MWQCFGLQVIHCMLIVLFVVYHMDGVICWGYGGARTKQESLSCDQGTTSIIFVGHQLVNWYKKVSVWDLMN